MTEGARCRSTEIVLEELDSVRHALTLANPGDILVICVDKHADVLDELEQRSHVAQPGAHG